MSEKAKKTPQQKKKTAIKACVIVVIAAAIIAVVCAVGLHKYRSAEPYHSQSISLSKMPYDDRRKVNLVAHRGYRCMAPENTVPAFRLAGYSGYWGAECDTYRTKDGVWVIQHNKTTYQLMNKKMDIEKSNYKDLQKLYYEVGNNVENYKNLRIATLDEYLAVCAEFKMTPVIELKSENNTEHYNEIVEAVKKSKTTPIYISFHKEDLVALRKLTDAKMFLLSDVIDDDAISDAKSIKNCGLEFSAGKKKNLKNNGELIKKAQKEGLETAAWGVNDYDTLITLYGLNTRYITTDTLTY